MFNNLLVFINFKLRPDTVLHIKTLVQRFVIIIFSNLTFFQNNAKNNLVRVI